MDQLEGWILDISNAERGMILWLKMRTGATVRCFYRFLPSFYAYRTASEKKKPNRFNQNLSSRVQNNKDTHDDNSNFILEKLKESLLENELIERVDLAEKYIDTSDQEKKKVFRIYVKNPLRYSDAVESVRKLGIFRLYNCDIPLVQLFMYETDLFPFCYCRFFVSKAKSKGDRNRNMVNSLDNKFNSFKDSEFYQYEIQRIEILDDMESIGYEYPPLRVLWLHLFPRTSSSSSVRPTKSDPIGRIELEREPFGVPFSFSGVATPDCIERFGVQNNENEGESKETEKEREKVVLKSPEEEWLIEEMVKIITAIDPDVILTRNGDEDMFPYLLARAEQCGVSHLLVLSRDGKRLSSGLMKLSGDDHYMSYGAILHRSRTQFYLNGRLHIDSAVYGSLHFDDGNMYGIIEISRISRVLPQRLTRITIGGALSSLQFYYAIKNDILIPEEKRNSEDFRSGYNLLVADRGGFIFQPMVGFFTDVAELDFSAMYPSIMVRYNVSPETLNCKCCVQDGNKVPGLAYHTCIRRTGIVPLSIKLPLTKRLKYKALMKTASGQDLNKYENINSALKWILVVCFGYLGFKNARFGRIEAHQTVCAYSREYLLRLSELASSKNFRALHGIVDSLWLQPVVPKEKEQKNREIKEICTQIEKESGLPIGFSPSTDRYKFIIFLPNKQFEEIGALNRYWGIKENGETKVRGIDLRRHDVPLLIKEYQSEIIQLFSKCSTEKEFMKCLWKEVRKKTREYFSMLESGKVAPDRLAVTIRVSRAAHEYKVDTYQSVASKQLGIYGIDVRPGQKVKYIITDAHNEDASLRVIIEELYSKRTVKYDIEKYKELIFRSLKNMVPFPIPEAFIKNDSSKKGLDKFLV